MRECPLCMAEQTLEQFPHLRNCPHLFCMECLHTYVKIEIQEGRANLKCPQCTELMHPNGKRVFFSKSTTYFGTFLCVCVSASMFVYVLNPDLGPWYITSTLWTVFSVTFSHLKNSKHKILLHILIFSKYLGLEVIYFGSKNLFTRSFFSKSKINW